MPSTHESTNQQPKVQNGKFRILVRSIEFELQILSVTRAKISKKANILVSLDCIKWSVTDSPLLLGKAFGEIEKETLAYVAPLPSRSTSLYIMAVFILPKYLL